MKKLFLILISHCCWLFSQAQEPEKSTTEQQLENIADADNTETEDDTYLQSLEYFKKNPINLNTATEADLKELRLLNALQVQNFFQYRKLFGPFINIYELQAIPLWSVNTIKKILPYVTIEQSVQLKEELGKRLTGGQHSLLGRVSYVLQKAKGFKLKNDTSAKNFYPGGRERIFLRYLYRYKNNLQYGIVADKDAGEQFFAGKQKAGFDFYSFHFFAKDIGLVKTLALGDFTANFGQGLTQWQSLAFRKNVDVLNIKRQSAPLRAYAAAGEFNFNRGVGITLGKNNWEGTFFVSYKKVDANFNADTLNNEDFFSSLLTSGLHRTAAELNDKNALTQFSYGANVQYKTDWWQLGFNMVQYRMDAPLKKSREPYNVFALSGKNFSNYSIDYSFTYKNLHWFGEAAMDAGKNKAFISGLLMNVAPKADLSFLYRNISKSYQTLYGNAFTESTFPTNENGLYAGVALQPFSYLRIEAYADFYSFPWLRYRVDAPSTGKDFLAQLTYTPNKQIEIYSRFRSEAKAQNYNNGTQTFAIVDPIERQSWRTQFSYKINAEFLIRQRIELLWYDRKGPQKENGFLSFIDLNYAPIRKKYSGTLRLQYFETDGYNSRIYAYENDVLYSFSIPGFFDKGFRFYLNMEYSVSEKLRLWFRIAQTLFQDKAVIGSGLDEIEGNKRTEIKLQALLRF